MTMFPAHRKNLKKKNGYGGGGGGGGSHGRGCGGEFLDSGYDCFISLGGGGGSDLMAEDESRTEASINNEEAGSSSKDINMRDRNEDIDGGWLQLSLGGGHVQSTSPYRRPHDQMLLGPRFVELDLLPGGSGGSSSGGGGGGGGGGGESSSQQQMAVPPLNLAAPTPQLSFQVPPSPPTFFLQPHPGGAAATTNNSVPPMTFSHQQQHLENINYLPFRHFPPSMLTTLNPPFSSSSPFSGSLEHQLPGSSVYLRRPPGGTDAAGPPPRMDFRVVDPPPRPHSGVWFMLQASQNQAKEPYLPQIPKSYLRIKDGRMTVRLLIKYLVNKLQLDSEFQIEISCKGQPLSPSLTLQHVRDNIWNSPRRNDVAFTLLPHSSATLDHLMLVNYGRIA